MRIIDQYTDHFINEEIEIDGEVAYYDQGSYYFIVPTTESAQVHIEQSWFADYLIEQGYLRVAKPIPNLQGGYLTEENSLHYIVLLAKKYPTLESDIAARLAEFHQVGRKYPYMPRYLSVYGQWHVLWQEKLALYEAYYREHLDASPASSYQRLLIDTFPYLIGLSENAIQYVQETNQETRFSSIDQPTIVFQRYNKQLDHTFIFANQLVYDHPTRDIAEYIRPLLLKEKGNQLAADFLRRYEKHARLSTFGWQLLYARLLFPIQLFDAIDQAIIGADLEETYLKYYQLLEKQVYYEAHLRTFFQDNHIDLASNQIHQLDW